MDGLPKLLTTAEVAEILKVDKSTVTRLLHRKVLIGTKAFGNWKIPEDEVRKAIQREINRHKSA